MTFGISFMLVGGGIVALPLGSQLRSGLAAGLVALVWSSLTLADTMALLSRSPLRSSRPRKQVSGRA
ncbi:hypothetical protein [Bradyrhizobium sp. SRS-191]|uniref:hypothetical protein n=1 Tax=Bradyrhizobium sp. SRS-191 TaxID=2962606 RepID=UPI00211EE28C|nr:hypothetical protein [Bradyrhizobium sp. SRS-191]